MIHNIPAMLKQMPRNGGTTLRMRRYNPLATALVPLGNSGVTPPPQQLTAVNIDAEMSFYGTYVILNEQVEALKVACYKPLVNTWESLKAA
jgi:N4-gp56 family major capsid protein